MSSEGSVVSFSAVQCTHHRLFSSISSFKFFPIKKQKKQEEVH